MYIAHVHVYMFIYLVALTFGIYSITGVLLCPSIIVILQGTCTWYDKARSFEYFHLNISFVLSPKDSL